MKIRSLQESCPALSRLNRTVKNGARYRVRTHVRSANRDLSDNSSICVTMRDKFPAQTAFSCTFEDFAKTPAEPEIISVSG